jgi:hypothetical protein
VLTQRYTPTVAINRSTVQVANPSNIHMGIVMAGPMLCLPFSIFAERGRSTRGDRLSGDQKFMMGVSAS